MNEVAQHHHALGEVAVDVIKASPPVAVSTWLVGGHALDEWLVLLTIIYTVLMIVHRLWTWNRRQQ